VMIDITAHGCGGESATAAKRRREKQPRTTKRALTDCLERFNSSDSQI